MAVRDPVARLADVEAAHWFLRVYPAAAEAGGCFVSSLERRGGGSVGGVSDPERSAREAGRRARGRLRRYCVANRLNRLGTLTYAGEGCHDPRRVRADVGEFFRALRGELGGDAFPYAWVPEWHKTDHGLHLHFAVGQYVPRGKIERAWGRGFVSIKLLSDLPVGSGTLEEARRAAGYLGKYVSKSFTDDDARQRPRGLHRFDVAEGFTPSSIGLVGTSPLGVLGQACELMGGWPRRSWSSADADGWQGPPAVWHQW